MTQPPAGPPDGRTVPRFAGPDTFARLPRLLDVGAADVALLGIPFDSGVSYRPGARFGPAAVRAGSKLLRPYNPALDVQPWAGQQVADAGDLASTRSTSARRSARSRPGPAWRWAARRG